MTVFELIEANGLNLHGNIEHFAALVEAAARADEREECAKLFDNQNIWDEEVAIAIRARGTT